MEMTVKSELCPTKHNACALECGHVAAPKCVKRRRRNPSAVALTQNEQQNGTLIDQSSVSNNASSTSNTTTTVKRSSRFRGVSRHRWTGRYEAHLWDKGSWNPTQRKKGKQVYLGAYDEEESAARAYDLAAVKYWGTSTFTNFPVSEYEKEVEIMKPLSKEEYLASLRRRSSGFSRGVSKYRGVARHHHNGRWEARIGRVFGNKYLYLGTYSTQEEAAHAYDIAAIEYRGINAVTNFDLRTYIRWLRPISNPLASQEPNPQITTTTSNSYPIPTNEKQNPSIFNLNPFTTTLEVDLDTPKHHDIFQRQITPISPCRNSSPASSSSSPSALGLLLKSTVFRDLVEKNLCSENKECDVKSLPLMQENPFDMISYNGIGNVNCATSENSYAFLDLESQDESALPFSSGRGQNIWNLSAYADFNSNVV